MYVQVWGVTLDSWDWFAIGRTRVSVGPADTVAPPRDHIIITSKMAAPIPVNFRFQWELVQACRPCLYTVYGTDPTNSSELLWVLVITSWFLIHVIKSMSTMILIYLIILVHCLYLLLSCGNVFHVRLCLLTKKPIPIDEFVCSSLYSRR